MLFDFKTVIIPAGVLIGIILLAFGMGNLPMPQQLSPETIPVDTRQPPIQTDAFDKAPPTDRTPVNQVSILVNDGSPTWQWHWDKSCRPRMEGYLGKRYPMDAVEIRLVDDPTLSLGAAYPELGTAQAISQTDCSGEEGKLLCMVTVGFGEESDALDMVVTAAILYGIDEYHRPKVREEWDESETWDWSRFEPLIEQTDNGWLSTCLTMEKE